MKPENLADLLAEQQAIIEKIAQGAPLQETLESVCLFVETMLARDDARCSVLLLEGDTLRHGAAPSLPPAYCAAVDGVAIGPKAGSCGTAACRGEQVIVSDIATDPLWTEFRDLALPHGLKACWSTPIRGQDDAILGTFAIYYPTPKAPEPWHLELISRFTHLCAIVIERHRTHQREQALMAELRASNEQLRAFTRLIPDLGFIIDDQGRYEAVYGARDELLFQPRDSLIGRTVEEVLPPEAAAQVMAVIRNTLETGEQQTIEYQLPLAQGTRIFEGRTAPVDHYDPARPERRHVLWMARDVTERHLAEEKIRHLAYYDPLTLLPNRRMLTDRLEELLELSLRHDEVGALLYLDLDHFKRINDVLGHSIGDRLLQQVADRLRRLMRASDLVARIGGDEFVIVLDHSRDQTLEMAEHAAEAARRILEELIRPFSLSGTEYRIGASIGISMIDAKSASIDALLRQADIAMYHAKSSGRNRFAFYDPQLQEAVDHYLRTEEALQQALEAGILTAWFQPQVDAQGRITGAEALVRWPHPERGMIPPDQFLPVAEQTGLIHPLQKVVMRHACDLVRALEALGRLPSAFRVAVNISPSLFHANPLASTLDIVTSAGLSPRRFTLELTEHLLMDTSAEVRMVLEQLRCAGFRLSIDDFGTGYSSLAYLKNFPVDEIKIDRSFVESLTERTPTSPIIEAIVALARSFGFHLVAEGVETRQQSEALISQGVGHLQGYYYGRPMPAEAFLEVWQAQVAQSPSG